jgi:hypothetical protein
MQQMPIDKIAGRLSKMLLRPFDYLARRLLLINPSGIFVAGVSMQDQLVLARPH